MRSTWHMIVAARRRRSEVQVLTREHSTADRDKHAYNILRAHFGLMIWTPSIEEHHDGSSRQEPAGNDGIEALRCAHGGESTCRLGQAVALL
jgi:hypothetical protein